ncbi:MAG: PIN domain-containing protein [Bacteroidia bacterium]|nr:PIN domain-containing protein [Bacteroidia bacterium]
MFAIDTNILVYAHNKDSSYNKKASAFLEKAMNERNDEGILSICIPTQVLMEFINVITRQNVEKPLSLSNAIEIVKEYIKTGITIINHRETQIQTFLDLLSSMTTRKKVFDVALAATLKDNNIKGLYTVNVTDFKDYDFLEVKNPL